MEPLAGQSTRLRGALVAVGVAAAALVLLAPWIAPADWGAAAVVYPYRKPVTAAPTLPHQTVRFAGDGERFEGWLFTAVRPRALVVYLHGIGDNRESGIGVAQRLVPRGFAVLAFDARAHGRSTGRFCTYGYRERYDVGRALDAVSAREAVLLGHSLGAAVALQAAAAEPRVRAVVAASTFADLGSVVAERAARLHVPAPYVGRALERAGQIAAFPPAEASPLALACRVRVPVLLLHGADDPETSPSHSNRVAAALGGPHELRLLAGVGHNDLLSRPEAWREIDAFLERLFPEPRRAEP